MESNMFEFRWVGRQLQYRERDFQVDASGSFCGLTEFGPWQTVKQRQEAPPFVKAAKEVVAAFKEHGVGPEFPELHTAIEKMQAAFEGSILDSSIEEVKRSKGESKLSEAVKKSRELRKSTDYPDDEDDYSDMIEGHSSEDWSKWIAVLWEEDEYEQYWCIAPKDFWDEHHYIPDKHLSIVPDGFFETREHTLDATKSLPTQEQNLRKLGFQIVRWPV